MQILFLLFPWSHCEPFSLECPEKLPAATHCDVHPFNLLEKRKWTKNDNNAFGLIVYILSRISDLVATSADYANEGQDAPHTCVRRDRIFMAKQKIGVYISVSERI